MATEKTNVELETEIETARLEIAALQKRIHEMGLRREQVRELGQARDLDENSGTKTDPRAGN